MKNLGVWIVLALLVILTIIFMTGHGGGLIAGYNAMSEEEKRKYDIKKISRRIGLLFLVIDIAVLIGAIWF